MRGRTAFADEVRDELLPQPERVAADLAGFVAGLTPSERTRDHADLVG
jgi:hypothetical protein